jgi:hypothetical protein
MPDARPRRFSLGGQTSGDRAGVRSPVWRVSLVKDATVRASPQQLFDAKATMNKRQLIDAIREHNPTVTDAFLDQFTDRQLKEYLDHLDAARRKELLIAGWTKPRPRIRLAS